MQLEDYFEFLAPNDIRLKGHRIGIETILFDYLELGLSAEEIALRYPTLSLEQVHATLAYYWRQQAEMDAYLQAASEHEARVMREQAPSTLHRQSSSSNACYGNVAIRSTHPSPPMNPPCFLLDENMPHRAIRKLVRQREPSIPMWLVGQPGAPSLGARDPELLVWIKEHHCPLVTRNRASMPGYLRDHLAAGKHVPGILIMPKRMTAWQVADELHLIWGTSQPGEYQDQIVYLPVA